MSGRTVLWVSVAISIAVGGGCIPLDSDGSSDGPIAEGISGKLNGAGVLASGLDSTPQDGVW